MNIYALSTGRGPSGIAIVRVSGKETLKICQNFQKIGLKTLQGTIFQSKTKILVHYLLIIGFGIMNLLI